MTVGIMLKIMLRKQYSPLLARYISISLKVSYCDSSVVKSDPKVKSLFEDDFSRVVKKPFEKNFVENLFIKKFQCDVLEYPQLDTIEEVERLNMYGQLAHKLITDGTGDENALCETDSKKAVSTLKKHEFTGFKIPRVKNGFGFLSSEYSYMQEALGVDPSLCKTCCENEDYGIQLINSFGSETQKEQYLRKLISGEYLSSFAHLESGSFVPFVENSLRTSAVFSPDNQTYTISGTKTWVYNANFAEVFIVSACVNSKEGEVSKPTFFLINKNLPGVVVHEPIETIGMKNLNICDITFNEVVVPSSCVLGKVSEGGEIIKRILSDGKLNIGGQCLGIMKKLINLSINHCIHNEFFGKEKYKMNYFRIKIGQMAARIYVLESMTYLLTGRFDSYTDPDVFLESLIIKVFSSEALQFVVKQTMGILGNEFFTSEENLNEIVRDSQFFMACDDTNDHLKLVLASNGVKHAIKHTWNPLKQVSKLWDSVNFINIYGRDNVLITEEKLEEYLHLMFYRESAILEDSVDILDKCTQYLIRTYGDNAIHKYVQLKYLADVAINIYAMTATLGRASRAYCLALQYHEVDRLSTKVAIRMLALNNRKTRKLIRRSKTFDNLSKITSSISKSDKYSDVYSVLRNLTPRNQNNRVLAKQ